MSNGIPGRAMSKISMGYDYTPAPKEEELGSKVEFKRRISAPAFTSNAVNSDIHKISLANTKEIKCGYLTVTRTTFLRKKTYFFVLNRDLCRLIYYKTRHDYTSGSIAYGSIDLSKCSLLLDHDSKGGFFISETRFKTHKLIASNESDRLLWVQALQTQRNAMKHATPTEDNSIAVSTHITTNVISESTKNELRRSKSSYPHTPETLIASNTDHFYTSNQFFPTYTFSSAMSSKNNENILNSPQVPKRKKLNSLTRGASFFRSKSPSVRIQSVNTDELLDDHDLLETRNRLKSARRKSGSVENIYIPILSPVKRNFTENLSNSNRNVSRVDEYLLEDSDTSVAMKLSSSISDFCYDTAFNINSNKVFKKTNTLSHVETNYKDNTTATTTTTTNTNNINNINNNNSNDGNNTRKIAAYKLPSKGFPLSEDVCILEGSEVDWISDERLEEDDQIFPQTFAEAQVIIQRLQEKLRESRNESTHLKKRELSYQEIIMHRDLQLLSFEENKDATVNTNNSNDNNNTLLKGVSIGSRKENIVNTKLKRHNEEISAQLEQTKGERLILSVEVKNLERELSKREMKLHAYKDKLEESKKSIKYHRQRYLTLLGYNITNSLGSMNDIIIQPEFTSQDNSNLVPQFSLEDRINHDIIWLWYECKKDIPALPDLFSHEKQIYDAYGDSIEPSQEDRASVLDAVRYLLNSIKLSNYPAQSLVYKEKKELKKLIRKGIHDLARNEVWLYAIKSHISSERKSKPQNFYLSLVAQAQSASNVDNKCNKDIEIDLYRTFPANYKFSKSTDNSTHSNETNLIPALRRVLGAYALYDPNIGYCQGMNYLAGCALHVLNEEDAFWCLVTILNKLMPESYYSGLLLGAIADQLVLSDIIQEKLPKLGRHMMRYGIDTNLVCLDWFITAFANVLPTENVLKIWDHFLLDGRKTLFRFTLAILNMFEHILLTKEDPILFYNYIRTVVSRWLDFDELRELAYGKFKTFPTTSRLEEIHKARLHEVVLQHKKIQHTTLIVDNSLPKSISRVGMTQSQSNNSPAPHRKESLPLARELKWECCASLSSHSCGFLIGALDKNHSSFFLCESKSTPDEQPNYNLFSLELELDYPVFCLIEVGPFWILGAANGWLYGLDNQTYQMLWKSDVKETPLCSFSFKLKPDEVQIFIGLADGHLFCFPLEGLPQISEETSVSLPEIYASNSFHYSLGKEPVTCLESPRPGLLCCGVGGRISVLKIPTLVQLYEIVIPCDRRRTITVMKHSQDGLWVSMKGTSELILYDVTEFSCLLLYRVDYNPFVLSTTEFSVSSISNKSVLPISKRESRATAILARGDEMWIGTHNGLLLLFRVNNKYGRKSSRSESIRFIHPLSPNFSTSVSDDSTSIEHSIENECNMRPNLELQMVKTLGNFAVRVLIDCFDLDGNNGLISASGLTIDSDSIRYWTRSEEDPSKYVDRSIQISNSELLSKISVSSKKSSVSKKISLITQFVPQLSDTLSDSNYQLDSACNSNVSTIENSAAGVDRIDLDKSIDIRCIASSNETTLNNLTQILEDKETIC